jgi:hypothetical protein
MSHVAASILAIALAITASDPATKTSATPTPATKTLATKESNIIEDPNSCALRPTPHAPLWASRTPSDLCGLSGQSSFVASPAFAAQAPLPDVDAFLRAARENLARAQQVAHHYSYKERRVDMHMNPFGRMGMGDTRVMEVHPSPNPRLTRRRVIERNGKPVSAAELAQQDADYRQKVEEVRRRLAREDAEDRQSRERDEALARQRAQMMIADVVNTLRFQVVRREMRNGVPAVVVTFAGRPEARPVTREGRTAKVFKGTLWIHEAAREVMDVEAVAIDDVTYGGFIAKLYEGTLATLVRREIDPGVWMPIRVKLEGEARALFRRTKIDFSVEWFDYQRISTSSAHVPIPKPALHLAPEGRD